MIYILIALIVIGGAIVFLTKQPANAPEAALTDEVVPTVDVSDQMPADGNKAVEETVVIDNDNTGNGDGVMSDTKTFDLSGTNFAYDVTEIRVQEGDTVTINFESADGFHDWVVDEFSAATEKVNPGQVTSVTFVANKAGNYEYYCSVGKHRQNGMVGTLIVE